MDLNRVYPGSADGGITERVAQALWRELDGHASALVTLHSWHAEGAATPYVEHAAGDEDGRALAHALGVPFVEAWDWPPGLLPAAATRAGVVSAELELGGLGAQTPQMLAVGVAAVAGAMRHLGMLAGEPPRAGSDVRRHVLAAAHDGRVSAAAPARRCRLAGNARRSRARAPRRRARDTGQSCGRLARHPQHLRLRAGGGRRGHRLRGNVNSKAIPWTPGLGLRCSACDWTGPPELRFDGCERCHAPLETTYADGVHMPIPLDARTDLGIRATRLVPCRSAPATFLKLESENPTGSHKDRFHAVTSALARLSGAAGIVTASTGNHGVSCAAHAARDCLPCVVFATGELPRALSVQIGAYGADVMHVGEDERRARVRAMTAADWLPATSSDPALSGAGNPYGLDGYAAIADEIVDERIPARHRQRAGRERRSARGHRSRVPPPRIARATGARRGLSAVRRLTARSVARRRPPGHAGPPLLARAINIRRLVRPARIRRVQDDCALVTVNEHLIAEATRRLALEGFYVETSSALALAGVDEARARGLADPADTAVAIVTANGRGWSEEAEGLFSPLPSARAASRRGSRFRQA